MNMFWRSLALAILGAVLASSLEAVAQAGKTLAQSPSATAKKRQRTQILSVAQLHEVARTVSVEVSERIQEAPGYRHLGSGVWLAEGFVATCWHVVNGVHGPIKVSLGAGGVVTYGDTLLSLGFADEAATVAASDPASDVAILKTEENPFKSTPVLLQTPTQKVRPKLGLARVSEDIPVAGTLTVLSGYPLRGDDLVSQTGNVAGTAAPEMSGIPRGGTRSLRILVSVVSNPGNSGGPVFNDHGELIGILEGNLPSGVKDETSTQAVYVRPKKGADGKIMTDADGKMQFEVANMWQNSGISVVIPAHLLTPLLKQAQQTK